MSKAKAVTLIISLVILSFLLYGFISHKHDMMQYTLYSSSLSDDRWQDVYVATFKEYNLEGNHKACEAMIASLKPEPPKRSYTHYECRRGPYMPYKFMIRGPKPSWFSWKLKQLKNGSF